jgi:filamentous hemagglutinin family protein
MALAPVRIRRVIGVALACAVAAGGPSAAGAQIVLDGRLGPPGGALVGPDYRIDSTRGVIRGGNLFHSFEAFHLRTIGPTIESATFTNSQAAAIGNVVSRVTGGAPSVIDGRLVSAIPGAHFYFLNPAGIAFGPNASLDIGGAFHASTAHVLRFANGDRFFVDPARPSVLSVAQPVAFGFLGPAAARITVDGSQLRVAPGQTLSLVGGDIRIDGGVLVAAGGRINLGSIAGHPGAGGEEPLGEVRIGTPAQPELGVEGATRLGRIDVLGSEVDASGAAGGTVAIRAGDLLVDRSLVFADTLGDARGATVGIDVDATRSAIVTSSAVTTDSLAAGRSGDIRIAAPRIEVGDGAVISSRPSASGPAGTVTLGDLAGTEETVVTRGAQITTDSGGGDIRIAGRRVELSDAAVVSSASAPRGPGGAVTLEAAAEVVITGGAAIATDSRTDGAGGDIRVAAPRVELSDRALILSRPSGTGQGGSVTITATGEAVLTQASQVVTDSRGPADGGDIRVVAPRVEVSDGARIRSFAFAAGRGGSVTIGDGAATGEALVTRGAQVTTDSGGDIRVAARRIAVRDGAVIASNPFGAERGGAVTLEATAEAVLARNALVTTDSSTGAASGDIRVAAPRIELSDSAVVRSRPSAGGDGGTVTLEAADGVVVTRGSQVITDSRGAGDGRDIRVTASRIELSDRALIASRPFAAGRGGSATLAATTEVVVTRDSQIVTESRGAGDSGDIRVAAPRIELSDRALIASRPLATGRAGSVAIDATGQLVVTRSSFITTDSAATGDGGEIRVAAPRIELTDGGQILSRSGATGRAGSATVAASESILIRARPSEGLETGIFVQVDAGATGAGGRATVTAPSLALVDGGRISATTGGTGRGGDIVVDVGTLTLDRGGRVESDSFGAGPAGTISIDARDSITISGGTTFADAPDPRPSGVASSTSGGAPAGRISVTSPVLTVTGGVIQAETSGDGAAGGITLAVDTLTLSGGGQVDSSTTGAGAGGQLTVGASALTISGADGPAASGLFSTAGGTGDAGQITVTGRPGSAPPTVSLTDGGRLSVATIGPGRAGGIELSARQLIVSGGARIDSGTTGDGQGGTARIAATESIAISGRDPAGAPAGIFSAAGGRGAAGQVVISTPILTMVDGAVSAQTRASGAAGGVVLDVGRLALSGGAQIDSTSFGAGAGGTVSIAAAESVTIAGRDNGMRTNAQGDGAAGQVVIVTPVLVLTDGASISALTGGAGSAGDVTLKVGTLTLTGGSSVSSSTAGSGRGGTVSVTDADLVSLDGSRLSSAASARGIGGDITVSASRVSLANGAEITTTSTGTEDAQAGSILIEARTSFQSVSSSVKTDAAAADGGDITLLAAGPVILRNSSITASVQKDFGQGGNILIGSSAVESLPGSLRRGLRDPGPTGGVPDPQFLILDRSVVAANAVKGSGGRVRIGANVFLQSASSVTASSSEGPQGFVDIEAQFRDVSGTLSRLPEAILQAAALLRESCASRVTAGRTNTLALGGRDGLPAAPGATAPSPLGTAPAEPAATAVPGRAGEGARLPTLVVELRCQRPVATR